MIENMMHHPLPAGVTHEIINNAQLHVLAHKYDEWLAS
jgi:hypothetical protein